MTAVSLAVPTVSQLPGTAHYIAPPDGTDANHSNNCGEAVLAAAIAFCDGPLLAPDAITDAVFGDGHTGPSAMGDYTAFLARYGVRLAAVSGDPATLLARIRAELAAGRPSIILIPSSWGMEPPPTTGFLHFVILKADDGAGRLTAMNPWGGFDQSGAYSWWQERIRLGSIWIVEKTGAPIMADAGLGSGFAAYQTAHPAIGACVSGGEHVYDTASGSSFAGFEHAPYVLTFYQGKVHDDLGGYTAAALWNELVGARDAAAKAAETNAAALAKQVSALTGQLTDAKAALKTTDADLAAAESQIGNLTEELANARQQLTATQAALRALLAVVPVIRAALAAGGIK